MKDQLPKIERRFVTVTDLQTEERGDGQGIITGHAAVFNQLSEDLGGFREMIAPGAFLESIQADDVRALFNHDGNFVLGRNKASTLELAEDGVGLAVRIKPPATQWAKDLLISMKRGDVTQMSFGFQVMKDGQKWMRDGTNVIRSLLKLRLFDVSPVTFPAYPQTDVSVRSYQEFLESEQKQGAEAALRSLSRRELYLRLLEAESRY